MTDTKPNAELAYRTLDLINAHREHFDMSSWVRRGDFTDAHTVGLGELTAECGTTACFAGWTLVLAGYRLNHRGDAVRDGETFDTKEAAATLLGIDADTATLLFLQTDEEEIEDAVVDFFGPRPCDRAVSA